MNVFKLMDNGVVSTRRRANKATRAPNRKARENSKLNNGGFVKRERPSLSRSDILNKVNSIKNEETKQKDKANISKIAQLKSNNEHKDAAVKSVKLKDGERLPDGMNSIKNNDPTNLVTRGKLKEALKSGIVNFSNREREILNKIL